MIIGNAAQDLIQGSNMRMSKGLIVKIVVNAMCCAPVFGEEGSDDITGYDPVIDTVLTPTRSKISLVDSPVPVTRLSSEKLFQLGITSLDDAMRLVPGFLVGYENGNIPKVSYHGTSSDSPKRMEVVMDKLPIYRPSHARVDWIRFPIRTSDINSIEVARGAGVVDYGSNSFLATVNMLSTTTFDRRWSAGAQSSSRGDEIYEASASWVGNEYSTSLRLNAIRFNGFDEDIEGNELSDSSDMESVFYKFRYSLGPLSSISIKAIASKTDYEYPIFPGFVLDRKFEAAQDDKFILLSHENTFVGGGKSSTVTTSFYISDFQQEQEFYRYYPLGTFNDEAKAADRSETISMSEIAYNLITFGRLPVIDPAKQSPEDVRLLTDLVGALLANPKLISLVPGHDNQDTDEKLYGVEFEHLFEQAGFKNSFNAVGRNISMDSQTYLGGTVDANIWSLSDSISWAAYDFLQINVGVAGEKSTLADSLATSYRAAINLKPKPWQTIRINYSVSKRLPDIYDTSLNWVSHVTFESGYTDVYGNTEADMFHVAKSPDDVDPERLESFDISWFANFYENDLTLDIKFFKENFSDLISEPTLYLWLDQSNNGWLKQKGVELGAVWMPNRFEMGATYMYLDAEAPALDKGIPPGIFNYVPEKSLYARHAGSLYGMYKFDMATLSIAYYGNSVLGNGAGYDRFDFTATKSLYVTKGVGASMSFNARYYPKSIYSPAASEQDDYRNVMINSPREIFAIRLALDF